MTVVEFIKSCSTTAGTFKRGSVVELEDRFAANMIRVGYARPTDKLPPWKQQMLDRLTAGADKPCVFMPFLGEFGHLVMSHIRLVHFHQSKEKVVCCRPHERVLFPSATSFEHDWTDPIDDKDRCGTGMSTPAMWPQIVAKYPNHRLMTAGDLTRQQQHWCLYPDRRVPFRPLTRGLKADVVMSTRRRAFDAPKNWKHWQMLADAMMADGHTVAVVGHPATSQQITGAYMSEDTDAAIELLQQCKLYIGSDTGAAHLAAEAQAPMLVFGLYDQSRDDYRPRMVAVNHKTTLLDDVWNDPHAVIQAARRQLGNDQE